MSLPWVSNSRATDTVYPATEPSKFGRCFSKCFTSTVNLIGLAGRTAMIALETWSYFSAAMDIGFFQLTPLRMTCSLILAPAAFAVFLDVLPAILAHSTPPVLHALRDLARYGR